MSKKKIVISGMCAGVLLIATVLVIFVPAASTGPQPVVQFLSYTNVSGSAMSLFVVSNSTSISINFRTSPEYYTGSESMPRFMPLPPRGKYIVTVPRPDHSTSVKFEFVARNTYLKTLFAALGDWRIRDAVKVTSDRISGITYFSRRPDFDVEISLP